MLLFVVAEIVVEGFYVFNQVFDHFEHILSPYLDLWFMFCLSGIVFRRTKKTGTRAAPVNKRAHQQNDVSPLLARPPS